jgi:hypothetical protein
MKLSIVTCFLIAMALSFFAGKEIASNEIYYSLEAYHEANYIEPVRAWLVPNKTRNPNLKSKEIK